MYPVKRLCDLMILETAAHFGGASFGVVGWACQGESGHGQGFKKQVEQLETAISQ